jgi:cysteine desulfurase
MNKKIYLDYAASTPVDQRVLAAMRPYFSGRFGNPGSLHSFGQEAIAAVDKARETIAKAINANSGEIIFTGSATESNNIALRGLTQTLRRFTRKNFCASPRNVRDVPRPRIIVSAIEHESVLETAEDLSAGGGSAFSAKGGPASGRGGKKDGVEVIYLPVNKNGLVDLVALKKSLNERTILVSIMYANNEIGTIQPLFEIKKIIDDFKKRNFQFSIFNFQKNTTYHPLLTTYPLFHTDAAQAFQFLDCDVEKLGVDLLTLSSHKIYGPKGIGALYVHGLPTTHYLLPTITGGGQEFGLRSGTENVPAIVGFAEAVRLIAKSRERDGERIAKLRDYFWKELKKIYPKAEINGVSSSTNNESDPNKRIRKFVKDSLFADKLPNILNVYFPHHTSEYLLTKFDLAGLAASSGSACRSRALAPSYVIKTLGHSEEGAKHSVRFSFGRPTTKNEIQKALIIIKNCLR